MISLITNGIYSDYFGDYCKSNMIHYYWKLYFCSSPFSFFPQKIYDDLRLLDISYEAVLSHILPLLKKGRFLHLDIALRHISINFTALQMNSDWCVLSFVSALPEDHFPLISFSHFHTPALIMIRIFRFKFMILGTTVILNEAM